jgi:predicted membrane GTPase involved in stress response
VRNAILTASRGTAILNTIFDSYGPWAGDISTRDQGSLVISKKKKKKIRFFPTIASMEMVLMVKTPGYLSVGIFTEVISVITLLQ